MLFWGLPTRLTGGNYRGLVTIDKALAAYFASAVLGGTGSVLGDGKFMNGAVTASFGYLYSSMASGKGGFEGLEGLADTTGKLWNLPNTAIGLGVGTLDSLASLAMGYVPSIGFGNDALQISNLQIGPSGGITFGNVQLYTGNDQNGQPISPGFVMLGSSYTDLSGFTIGSHEQAHALQSQVLGPFFFPAYFMSGGISRDNSFETQADHFAKTGSSPYPW